MKFAFVLVDRQTGKKTTVLVEAKTRQEAKHIAMRDFGHSYQIQ